MTGFGEAVDSSDVAPPDASPPTKKLKTPPDSWNAETSPFVVLEYCAKEGVTRDDIAKEFRRHKISSLQTLKSKIFFLDNIIDRTFGGGLVDKINAAVARTGLKPVDILGGVLEHDSTCIDQKSLNLYTLDAVSATERGPPRYRYPKITLVTGPSGSGKTMYALNCLPERVFPGAVSKSTSFRVHLKASVLLGDNPDRTLDLPTEVVKQVTASVARRLPLLFGQTVMPIDLYLFVTIDEAGRTEYATFFDSASKIEHIVSALETMKDGYKFEKGVHVTVTGTGLETSTRNIDTSAEARKVAMQPWLLTHFYALLRKLKRVDEEPVKRFVGRFPVLNDLTTNARCAYFLSFSIPTITFENEPRWAAYIDVTVAGVAREYINSNGLKSLSSMTDKFIVVQEAFKAINEAMVPATNLHFPSFEQINDNKIRSVTRSLFGINVEMKNGKPKLTDKYSLSMTPAIAIVLAELLCANAIISWNWQGFETTVALGEWKRMITTMQLSEFTNYCGIINLQSPVLAGSAKANFTVPVVSRSTVLVNGPAAPYADVIAPFRLLRAQFSVKANQEHKMDFQQEMGKMGLTTQSEFQLNQAVTSVLYVMWQKSPTTVNDDHVGRCESPGRKADERCEHYPYQVMLSSYDPPIATAHFKTHGHLWRRQLEPDDGDYVAGKLLREKPIKILEEFSSERPVTAVFVTNCDSFRLSNGTSPVTISRHDVDWQGQLKIKTLPNQLVSILRSNVKVRFLFY